MIDWIEPALTLAWVGCWGYVLWAVWPRKRSNDPG